MSKARLEAFSDAVIAIIITIMVLELKAPEGHQFEDLLPLIPGFLSYLLSFAFLGIYWNNHHHLLQAAKHVNGIVLWANLHFLFWLSLVPFATDWMGVKDFDPQPTALYGIILFLVTIAYSLLGRTLINRHGRDSTIAIAIGKDIKGKISLVVYAIAVLLSLVHPKLSCGIYALVAVMWLIPDRRIEKLLN